MQENFPQPIQNNKTEKQYLYHKVPEKMEGSEIKPLSVLKEEYPVLYSSYMEKYKGREFVSEQFVEYLGAHWKELVMFSPVSPEQIKEGLLSAGYDPGEMKFYQIDIEQYPDLLDPEKTTICLFEYDEEGNQSSKKYTPFNKDELQKHEQITPQVIKGYAEKIKNGNKPLLFLGIPHIMHKGSVDISECPIITV